MGTDIFYFSGTGNSLFIAKHLQERIPGSRIIPIAALTGQNRIISSAERIGIVFPVHALTIPVFVKRFIRKLDAPKGTYIFAAATRAGSVFRGFEEIERILKRKHLLLSAAFILQMYTNESRHGTENSRYKVPSSEEISRLEKKAVEKIDAVEDIILSKQKLRVKDTESTIATSGSPLSSYVIEKFVLFCMNLSELIGGVNYFYHDAKCNRCGICEKICLSGKIRMSESGPEWQKKVFCSMCFACLNFCPQESVQIHDIPGVKSYTAVNGRYPHPYADVNDIANQKKIFKI